MNKSYLISYNIIKTKLRIGYLKILIINLLNANKVNMVIQKKYLKILGLKMVP